MDKKDKIADHPSNDPVLREAAEAFFTLVRRSFSWFQAAAAEQELSPFHAKILLYMDPERPCSMSEVAEMAACGPSHITGVIDKLEARRLVRRSAVKGDRRVKQVSITRSGLAVRRKLSESLARPVPWMQALSRQDQRQLRDILLRGLASELAEEKVVDLHNKKAGKARGQA